MANPTKETTASNHPVVKWVEAVKNNSPDISPLRQEVVSLYSDLPTRIIKGTYWGIGDYTGTHKWVDLAKALSRKSWTPTTPTTMPEREALGLIYQIRQEAGRERKREFSLPIGVNLDPQEYAARLDFSEYFQHPEDWLASLGQIVWVNRTQLETQNKEQAQKSNVDFLQRLVGPPTREDVDTMYTNTVKAIRPTAQNIPIIRNDINGEDRQLPMLAQNLELKLLTTKPTVEGRRFILDYFLSKYQRLPDNPYWIPDNAAWIYATYLTAHIHPDYNGTMTRSLVDNYLSKNGFCAIEWVTIKGDFRSKQNLHKARENYVFAGNTRDLENWFRDHIHQTRLGAQYSIRK